MAEPAPICPRCFKQAEPGHNCRDAETTALLAERDSLRNQRDQAQCPQCNTQMSEVRHAVTGVCPTHGIQHG